MNTINLENAKFGDMFIRRDGERVIFHHFEKLTGQAYLIKESLDKCDTVCIGFVGVYLNGKFEYEGGDSPFDIVAYELPRREMVDKILTICNEIKNEEDSEHAPLDDCPYGYMIDELVDKIIDRY